MLVHTKDIDIAVFWDFQNIGMKKESSFAKNVLEFLKGRGRVVAAYAYADWTQCSGDTASVLYKYRYELLHIPNPSKNSADVLMTAHAMAHLTGAPNILEYAIISKDYDFRPLVANLQRMGKRVLLICRPIETRPDLIDMVDDYIDTQDLRTRVVEQISVTEPELDETEDVDLEEQLKGAYAQLQDTIRGIENRENLAGIGYAKIIMTSLNPGFNEVELGFEKWGDFVTAASNAGYVDLKGEGAGTILGIPRRISRSAKATLDNIQGGFDLLKSTIQELVSEEIAPELVRIAFKMRNRDPPFNHGNLGFKKFFDFVKAAEQRGLVEIEVTLGKEPIIRLPSDD